MMLVERLELKARKERNIREFPAYRRRYLPRALAETRAKLDRLIEEADRLGVPVPPEVCAGVVRCRELTHPDAVNAAWDDAISGRER